MAVSELQQLDDSRAARWELPPARMKARRAHVVPLPPLAHTIVATELERQRNVDPKAKLEFIFARRPSLQGS
jgi:hypothetical protein